MKGRPSIGSVAEILKNIDGTVTDLNSQISTQISVFIPVWAWA